MIKTKVAFLEAGFFPANQEGFLKTSDCSDWLDKSRPSKKATFVLITQTVNTKQAINDISHHEVT